MKKIYLLVSVACIFAFGAQAQDEFEGWTAQKVEDLHIDQVSGCVTFTVAVAGNSWDSQFVPPTWMAPSKGKEESFEISFEAIYKGRESAGRIDFIHGRQFGGFSGDLVELSEKLGIDPPVDKAWQIQGSINQLTVTETSENVKLADGQTLPGIMNRNVYAEVSKEWATYTIKGTLGQHAVDSVDLEIEFGKVAGTYSIRNFKFLVKEKEFVSYFTELAPGTAVEEVAAVNAYVAGGVLYASEATDVVICNISGVAVKVAKNVTTLNVADLKSGLYIAKVGNKAIKFVK